MKFQAEAESQRKIASQFTAAEDEIDLPSTRASRSMIDRAGGRRFFKMHFLLRVKLPHHLQQRGDFLFGEKLEERVHKGDSK